MTASWTVEADWPAPAGVRALTTTRDGPGVSEGAFAAFNLGDRCGDEPSSVAANRARLLEMLALPEAPRWLSQVHGRDVACFDRDGAPSLPESDASVSMRAGRVLAVLTADCLPVLLCSEDGSGIAVAHAGWRGLAAGVLEATVRAMATPPNQVLAWLGPAIGAQRYEVGVEVREAFVMRDAGAASAFGDVRAGHWHCDLYALARRRLAGCGVTRVYGGGLCTYSDAARFYSYRRDGRTGRMASLIWVER
ncbi:MAG TPA: peptidoglycan editing factor PgeF [Xanthomonadaceae bacterium]|nr:peptidoglycan editing factor PgeF [Xanthomonadaceae bacterium]